MNLDSVAEDEVLALENDLKQITRDYKKLCRKEASIWKDGLVDEIWRFLGNEEAGGSQPLVQAPRGY